MEYDTEKVDDAVLALLHLTTHGNENEVRAWKGHDWSALDRLHKKDLIGDPKSKAKSVVLTKEGQARSAELFRTMFGMAD